MVHYPGCALMGKATERIAAQDEPTDLDLTYLDVFHKLLLCSLLQLAPRIVAVGLTPSTSRGRIPARVAQASATPAASMVNRMNAAFPRLWVANCKQARMAYVLLLLLAQYSTGGATAASASLVLQL